MTSTTAIVLIGLGLGVSALIVADGQADRRDPRTSRESVIAAQKIAERAARHARDLAAQWMATESGSL